MGTIPSIVPPALSLRLFMPASAIALLEAVQPLSIKGDGLSGSQELIAQGQDNITACLTSGIPGCGSFTRGTHMVTLGARTRMGSVFSGMLQRITCRSDVCDLPPSGQFQATASGPSPNPR
ncbi:SulP family inorganic anion transporter [uncultured Desulfovibrio sp.]|uniref:SulP family inorganic anion transporter n=1 Tax=uncultured Desulfovibrio sp. TaxID=167968 RepID=UPI00039F3B60|nr:SulP family inorganic anion transporter [uncultured Desulfovibrio sp.]